MRENSRHKVCIVGLMETEVHSVKGLVEVSTYWNFIYIHQNLEKISYFKIDAESYFAVATWTCNSF